MWGPKSSEGYAQPGRPAITRSTYTINIWAFFQGSPIFQERITSTLDLHAVSPIPHYFSYMFFWTWTNDIILACHRQHKERQKLIATCRIRIINLQNLTEVVFDCLLTQLQIRTSKLSQGRTRFYPFIAFWGFVHILVWPQVHRASYIPHASSWITCMQTPDR